MYETALSSLVKVEHLYKLLPLITTVCFSLYLELQGDLSQAIEMYETALSSLVKAEHICMVWFG